MDDVYSAIIRIVEGTLTDSGPFIRLNSISEDVAL